VGKPGGFVGNCALQRYTPPPPPHTHTSTPIPPVVAWKVLETGRESFKLVRRDIYTQFWKGGGWYLKG
jgi:hypothetical protein